MEINIRPENAASLRVVEKLGFRDEGLRVRYLHIDGAWRDHRTFALTSEDLPESAGCAPAGRAASPPSTALSRRGSVVDGSTARPRSHQSQQPLERHTARGSVLRRVLRAYRR